MDRVVGSAGVVMLAVTVSGVVILACVLVVAAAGLVALAALDRRSRAPSPEAKFLDGLRRIGSRVKQNRG